MKIATYNVNGVNGRLLVLLRWLEKTRPDVACLQELKAPEEKFPALAIQEAVTKPFGMVKRVGMAWPFLLVEKSRAKPTEVCPAIPKVCTAATSRRAGARSDLQFLQAADELHAALLNIKSRNVKSRFDKFSPDIGEMPAEKTQRARRPPVLGK